MTWHEVVLDERVKNLLSHDQSQGHQGKAARPETGGIVPGGPWAKPDADLKRVSDSTPILQKKSCINPSPILILTKRNASKMNKMEEKRKT
ncbi:MAG TPA: hypothetical protein VK465_18330 [Fibrobacteria bacterium]|nr:hypothetical protein [Fibrobacteria bacterium]